MQLRELIADMLNDLSQLREEKPDDLLVHFESHIALDKLRRFLNDYLHKAGSTIIEYADGNGEKYYQLSVLKPFLELFSQRWLGIRNTDACYCHHPKSIGSLAYFLVAKRLAKHYPAIVAHMLMPNVGAHLYTTSRGNNLDAFKFYEYILSDEGRPIEILKCFEQALLDKTTELKTTDSIKRRLTKAEKNRVVHHSQETEDYYNALEYFVKNGVENDVVVGHYFLTEAMQTGSCQVKASYGETGKYKLMTYLLLDLETTDDFILFMNDIPQAQWQECLSYVSDDDLQRFILKNNSMILALQNKAMYNGDMLHDKAVLFCFAEIVKRKLTNTPHSQSVFNFFAPITQKYLGQYHKLITGYSDVDRFASVQALQTFLMTDNPLTSFHDYLYKHEQNTVINPLFELCSELALITDQMRQISDASYFVKQQPSIWNWLGF